MPIHHNSLFHRTLLHHALERHQDDVPGDVIQQKLGVVHNWRQAIESLSLAKTGEIALHGDFLLDLFGQVLGYARQVEHPDEWQLAHEQKTAVDATRSDGALGFFTPDSQDIRAVIELKAPGTDLDARQHRKGDRRSPVDQAFSYAHKAGGKCRWVIVSNYQEIRLYHASFSGKYEVFHLTELTDDTELLRFYILLAAPQLLAKRGESFIDALYRQSQEAEQAITREFYAKYSQTRREVFEHLKQQNPDRGELALLTHTQQLLDRFIFICFCEDTGDLLPEKTFRDLIQRTRKSVALSQEYGVQKIWTELKAFFEAMNDGLSSHRIPGFNGELFKPDSDFDSLRIEDDIFLKLEKLTEYDFHSDLNVNILGHIFEQSLNDLEEFRAEIKGVQAERKQSRRKKEGIFYTPDYITRYIVEQAIGGWLEDRRKELGEDALPELTEADEKWLKSRAKKKKPNPRVEQHIAFWEAYLKRLSAITVLDPACGSGAFLTQAFDYLQQEGERVNRELNRLRPGEQLGLFSRKTWDKRILKNNLFGVDLNAESLEITKLSLWLKTAKKDDKLASLAQNIKCGNSLIDDPLVAGEKAFTWAEEFPDIMQHGGFDVVIGNPPYVRQEILGATVKAYFEQTYQVYHGMADLFVYFFERGVSLLKPQGRFSIIVSNKWLRANYGKTLRAWLRQYNLQEIVDFGELPVFQDAATFPSIVRIAKTTPSSTFHAVKVKTLDFTNLAMYVSDKRDRVNVTGLQDEGWALIGEQEQQLIQKIHHAGISLHDYVQGKIYRGLITGLNKAFVIDESQKQQLITKDPKSAKFIKPFVIGDDIRRYFINWQGKYLILCPKGWTRQASHNAEDAWIWFQSNYPAIAEHLEPFAQAAQKRLDQGEYWWELRACEYYDAFEQPKIVYPDIARESRFAYDQQGIYLANTTYFLPTDDLYLLGVLNSKLMFTYFKRHGTVLGDEDNGGRLRWFRQNVLKLPIRQINGADPFEKSCHATIVEWVTKMIELNTQFHAAAQKFLRYLESRFHPKKLSKKLTAFYDLEFDEFLAELAKQKVKLSKKDEFDLMELFEEQRETIGGLQTSLDKTDREIDRLVYQLYGLTEEEIRCVESSQQCPS